MLAYATLKGRAIRGLSRGQVSLKRQVTAWQQYWTLRVIMNSLFIGTSNELGGFESGMVAHWLGPVFSVVTGGAGTILVVLAVALLWPEVRRYGRLMAE